MMEEKSSLGTIFRQKHMFCNSGEMVIFMSFWCYIRTVLGKTWIYGILNRKCCLIKSNGFCCFVNHLPLYCRLFTIVYKSINSSINWEISHFKCKLLDLWLILNLLYWVRDTEAKHWSLYIVLLELSTGSPAGSEVFLGEGFKCLI